MLKEPILYSDIEEFLHLYLKCIVKTHAEGAAESMDTKKITIQNIFYLQFVLCHFFKV